MQAQSVETKVTVQEQNKEVVLQYVDAFNTGDMEELYALFAPNAEIQGVLGKAPVAQALLIWQQLVTGFNMHLKVEEIIANEEMVAVRYVESGTFSGTFMGQEPTGKSYEVVAMEWFILQNGKIQQRWGARDQASIARQVGMPLN